MCLYVAAATERQADVAHTPLPFAVCCSPSATVGLCLTFRVDNNRMQCFQTTSHTVYHAVGGADDVLRTAVVVGQIVRLGNVVVFLEAVDVLVAGTVEGVDVLVIVADRQNGQLVFFSPLPTRKRRNKPIVFFTDVLVFIYQNIAEACHDTFACFIVTIIVFKVV